ncbi:MAG TPA: ABC transporter permease subunit, partial [Gemmataceae bacterium]|nr:ABC transporter permease subunit [Gemmataceae bacterium]
LVFAALVVTYLAAFPQDLDIRDFARAQARLVEFGQQFALILLLVQTAVVVLITPLFVAGAVVEETERKTLEFLLATDLAPREIVLGKIWPRLLLVLGVVLVGWPVLAVLQVWGGVDVLFVGLASVAVAATIWAVAGVSAASAVGARTLRQAMIRAYSWSFLVLTLPVCSCPFAVIGVLANAHEAARATVNRGGGPPVAAPAAAAGPDYVLPVTILALHVAVQFVIGLLGVRRATYKLRHAKYYYARTPWPARPVQPARWEQHPPVPDGSPLLWKELYLSGQTARLVRLLNLVPWVVWLCVASVFMVVGLAVALSQTGSVDVLGTMNEMARWGGGALVGLMSLMVGLHAAGSVARERQQETLTDLLMVPQPRRGILRAKWWGSLAKARGVAVGTLAVPLVGLLAEGISFWAVVPLFCATFAFIACAASFGLWVSVRAATVQRATGTWLLVVALWVGGTFLAAQAAYVEDQAANRMMTRRFPPDPEEPLIWDRLLNPALAWSQLTFRLRGAGELHWDYMYDEGVPDGRLRGPQEAWPSLLGVSFYAVLSWALFEAAARRFEREGR